MLVYSVGSRQSFDMVTVIRDKILNHLVIDDEIKGYRMDIDLL